MCVQEDLSEWSNKCSGMGTDIAETNFNKMLFADDHLILVIDELIE